jgi:hypothetical protein
MKIYFGNVPHLEALNMEDQGINLFKHDGMFFDFVLEANEDGFKITDALGRFVPFAHESIWDILGALKIIKPMSQAIANAEYAVDTIREEGEQCV